MINNLTQCDLTRARTKRNTVIVVQNHFNVPFKYTTMLGTLCDNIVSFIIFNPVILNKDLL